jgi:peptidyl-prolyl cis-trans isomerase SurA
LRPLLPLVLSLVGRTPWSARVPLDPLFAPQIQPHRVPAGGRNAAETPAPLACFVGQAILPAAAFQTASAESAYPISPPPDIIDRVAVAVGNHVITTSAIDREIRVTAFLNAAKLDITPAVKRATAGRMVEQALVRTELEASRYPTPPPSEVDPILAQLKKERFPTDADFQRALAEYGITEQDVRDELLWQRTLLSFLDVRFRPSVQVSDKEIEDYFEKTVKPAFQAAHAGQTVSIDEYRDQIEATLTGEREDQEMSKWLDQAKKRTEIVYHDDAF